MDANIQTRLQDSQLISSMLSSGDTRGVVISTRDGRSLRGRISTFNPSLRSVTLNTSEPDQSKRPESVVVDDVKFIAFLADGDSPWDEQSIPLSARILSLRLSDGEVVTGVCLTDAGPRRGLFLLPLTTDWYEFFYIPVRAIREILSVTHLDHLATDGRTLTLRQVKRTFNEAAGELDAAPGPTAQTDLQPAPAIETQATQTQKQQLRIGEILFEQGFVTEIELAEALTEQRSARNGRIGDVLVEMGFATFKMIGIALSFQCGLPFVELRSYDFDAEAPRLLPEHIARRWQVVPVSLDGREITIAIVDPTSELPDDVVDLLEDLTVKIVVATPQDIDRRINYVYGDVKVELAEALA